MVFSETQLQRLYDAEVHFINVCTRECLRNAPQWLTETVVSIYFEATGKKLQYKANCSACTFHVYKTVGRQYLSDKAELESAKQAEQKNIKPKKNGRKKGTSDNV